MSHKILIVDDEKNIRMTLRQCFSSDSYQLSEAVDGDEALKKLINNEFDLVLLDIRMPGLTGLEVLEKMREKSINTDVIIMTAYGSVEKAVEAMKLGAIDFIGKPFTPEEIREIVSEVLAREKLVESELEGYTDYLQFAKKSIMNQEYDKALEYLKKAVSLEIEYPEPYNLLGVIAEFNDEIERAQKHYRAALAYDPTYKPARSNLERSASYTHSKSKNLIDLGDKEIEKN
jgi:DNA-binding NtrC family response regulator